MTVVTSHTYIHTSTYRNEIQCQTCAQRTRNATKGNRTKVVLITALTFRILGQLCGGYNGCFVNATSRISFILNNWATSFRSYNISTHWVLFTVSKGPRLTLSSRLTPLLPYLLICFYFCTFVWPPNTFCWNLHLLFISLSFLSHWQESVLWLS